MNPGVDVEANIVFGLYFFLSYVIISVFLGGVLKRSLEESSSVSIKDV